MRSPAPKRQSKPSRVCWDCAARLVQGCAAHAADCAGGLKPTLHGPSIP
ncbi:MAG TPA: hypothetical protein DCR78_23025 [Pseudomonas sp.]|nr:DUF3079 domain-containing protein [Stutzerimonas xanthomarina]HAQ89291.1 hypothetical protein [Pseudomonas sp.]